MADAAGLESSIKLRKSECLHIGTGYRFYFRQHDRESKVYESRFPPQENTYLGMEKVHEESRTDSANSGIQ
jgi:hypothetical protein